MNSEILDNTEFSAISKVQMNALMRGKEENLIEQVSPLVRQQSVWLDLGSVERIDAAGIAALLTLYRAARDTGHRFTLLNVRPHVSEILALVGLDRVLISHNAVRESHYAREFDESAAQAWLNT